MRQAAPHRRLLSRHPDGRLSDEDTEREVALGELLDGLRSGHRFRVRLHTTGADCTSEVLVEVLGLALRGPGSGAGAGGAVESLRTLLFGPPAAGAEQRPAR